MRTLSALFGGSPPSPPEASITGQPVRARRVAPVEGVPEASRPAASSPARRPSQSRARPVEPSHLSGPRQRGRSDQRTSLAEANDVPRTPRRRPRSRRRVAANPSVAVQTVAEPPPQPSSSERLTVATPQRSSRLPRRRRDRGSRPAELRPHEPPAPEPENVDDGEPPRFGDIELSDPVARSIAGMGYSVPSPIQAQAIPHLQKGRDLVGQAVTGSGKTAAFAIPICERIEVGAREPQAIILVPTRELAMQVTRETEKIGARRGVRVCAVFGGQPIKRQLAQLERGVDVVVGTPGRVMDHMRRGTLGLGRVKFAVLDEADEMLDIGFAKDVEYILRHTPRSRQTMLFSATIPPFVRTLIRRYQNDPLWVRLGAEIQTVDEVDQIYYEVAERDKETAMREVLDEMDEGARVLVFRRMQIGVDRLVRALKRGYPVMGLHGGMSQPERDAAMGRFKAGNLPVLVSTNVAARGIDVRDISHVINYDMPDNVEEYVHRIGRTARMGHKGTAVSFLAEWDLDVFDQIVKHVGDNRLTRRRLSIYA